MNYQHCDEASHPNENSDAVNETTITAGEIETTPPTRSRTANPGRRKSYKSVIIPGALLLAFLLVLILWNHPSKKSINEDAAAILTQYAEGREWLADCTIEESAMKSSSADRAHYMLYDFDDDEQPELVITAVDGEKNADCLVYGLSGDQIELWGIASYYTDDPAEQIIAAEVATRDDYSGLALRLTLQVEEEDDAFVAFLRLSAKGGVEDEEAIRGVATCENRLQDDGWQMLSGTPINLLVATLMESAAPEDLVALAVLYTPDEPVYSYDNYFVAVEQTVYGLETTGLYRFSSGEKSTLSSAPADTYYSLSGGMIYNDQKIYFISLQSAQNKAIMCVDAATGYEKVLFELPTAEKILKADEQYVYVQTSSADKEQFGVIEVYDHQGNVAGTLKAPHEWDTCGTMVLAKDWKGNISVVTNEGEYLLYNTPVEDAVLTETGVYYLTTENEEATICFVDAGGNVQTVGSAPANGGARLKQLAETWLLVTYNGDETEAYYDLADMQCVYSGKPLMSYLPDSDMYSLLSVERDAVTGKVYLVPAYAPYGNCGSIYNSEFEMVRDGADGEMYCSMIYNNAIYYYYTDYDAGLDYFSSPRVTACKPIDPVSSESGNSASALSAEGSMTERAFGFWKGEKADTLYCFVGDEVMCLYAEPWNSSESEFHNDRTFFTVEEDEDRLLVSFEVDPYELACVATFSGDSIKLEGTITDTLLRLSMVEGLDVGAMRIEAQADAWSDVWTNMDILHSVATIATHWRLMVQAEITYLAEALNTTERETLYDRFEAWQEEVAAAAEESASEYEGGSLMPVAYGITYKELYAEKYTQLREQIG